MATDEIIQTIIAAGQARKLLWIVAREADGSVEPRAVEPYSFRPVGTYQRFYFWCRLHNGTRNFKLHNIIEVKILDEEYTPRFAVEF